MKLNKQCVVELKIAQYILNQYYLISEDGGPDYDHKALVIDLRRNCEILNLELNNYNKEKLTYQIYIEDFNDSGTCNS